MRKEYVFARKTMADYKSDPDAENYLARTVHEEYELIGTGVLDQNGREIMARRKMEPIGFVHFSEGK